MGLFVTEVDGQAREQVQIRDGGGVPQPGSGLSNGDSFSGAVSHRLNSKGSLPLAYTFENGPVIASANVTVV